MKPDAAAAIAEQIRYEQERDHYPEGFPPLPEIPGGRYISDEFHQLEMDHLWRKTWLCAVRADEIESPGSHKLFKRLGCRWSSCGARTSGSAPSTTPAAI